MRDEISHSDEGQEIVKAPRKLDWSLVLIVFFIGISVGALIPVGMKFFGMWNKPNTSSAKAIETNSPEQKKTSNGSRLKNLAAPSEALVNDAGSKSEAKKSGSASSTVALKSSKLKVNYEAKDRKVSNKEAASVPAASSSPAPLPASVSAVSAKGKKAAKEAPILEEMSSGPSAIEIQNLTMAVASSTVKPEPGTVSTPARVVAASPKADSPSPAAVVPVSMAVSGAPAKRGQLVSMSAKATSESAAGLSILSAMNPASAEEAKNKDSRSKVVAMVVNNASYNKTTLNSCQKRCLLMGLDAFGMPIKAIIDGAVYSQALKQHNGTINLAGQPRLVKNQQVLIVDSITFNISPKAPVADPNHNPAMKSEIPSDPDDPKPGSVVKESN